MQSSHKSAPISAKQEYPYLPSLQSMIYEAAKNKSLEELSSILLMVEINEGGFNGSAVHQLASEKDHESVDFLLNEGASIASAIHGYTSVDEFKKVRELLVRSKSSNAAKAEEKEVKDHTNDDLAIIPAEQQLDRTPGQMIYLAAKSKNINMLRHALWEVDIDVGGANGLGEAAPVIRLAMENDEESVNFLLNAGALIEFAIYGYARINEFKQACELLVRLELKEASEGQLSGAIEKMGEGVGYYLSATSNEEAMKNFNYKKLSSNIFYQYVSLNYFSDEAVAFLKGFVFGAASWRFPGDKGQHYVATSFLSAAKDLAYQERLKDIEDSLIEQLSLGYAAAGHVYSAFIPVGRLDESLIFRYVATSNRPDLLQQVYDQMEVYDPKELSDPQHSLNQKYKHLAECMAARGDVKRAFYWYEKIIYPVDEIDAWNKTDDLLDLVEMLGPSAGYKALMLPLFDLAFSKERVDILRPNFAACYGLALGHSGRGVSFIVEKLQALREKVDTLGYFFELLNGLLEGCLSRPSGGADIFLQVCISFYPNHPKDMNLLNLVSKLNMRNECLSQAQVMRQLVGPLNSQARVALIKIFDQQEHRNYVAAHMLPRAEMLANDAKLLAATPGELACWFVPKLTILLLHMRDLKQKQRLPSALTLMVLEFLGPLSCTELLVYANKLSHMRTSKIGIFRPCANVAALLPDSKPEKVEESSANKPQKK